MCLQTNQKNLTLNQKILAKIKRDPTRLGLVKRSFIADINKRFKWLKNLVWQTVSINDALGLRLATNQPAPPNAFDFPTSSEKVDAFMAWLTDMVDEGVLQTQTGPSVFSADPRWSDTYITSSYQQGIQRANEELYRQKHESIYESAIPATSVRDAMPMIQSFSLGAFNQPIHADAVGLIYTRTYNELKGVTDDMANKMSQILAQAVAEGRNPKEIYSQLSEQVGISSARARTIARTEMTRAHHVAGINAYRQAGIFNVKVLVEWATSGFSVCPDCADMEGRIFTLDEVFGLIPLHPNCRCVALPADVGETDDERVQGIRESIIGDEYKTKKGELKFRNFYQKKTGNKNPPPRSIRKARRRDRNERK